MEWKLKQDGRIEVSLLSWLVLKLGSIIFQLNRNEKTIAKGRFPGRIDCSREATARRPGVWIVQISSYYSKMSNFNLATKVNWWDLGSNLFFFTKLHSKQVTFCKIEVEQSFLFASNGQGCNVYKGFCLRHVSLLFHYSLRGRGKEEGSHGATRPICYCYTASLCGRSNLNRAERKGKQGKGEARETSPDERKEGLWKKKMVDLLIKYLGWYQKISLHHCKWLCISEFRQRSHSMQLCPSSCPSSCVIAFTITCTTNCTSPSRATSCTAASGMVSSSTTTVVEMFSPLELYIWLRLWFLDSLINWTVVRTP